MPPAVFRVKAQHGFPEHFTAASGSKIIAVLSMRNGFEYRPSAPSTSVPVFDLRRRGFMSSSFQVLYPPSNKPGGSGQIWEGSWRKLQMHPLMKSSGSTVTSYPLHPDGRTIFVSIDSGNILTFDTAEEHLSWTQHGQWSLPFAGRAHLFRPRSGYAWVIGLSGGKDIKGHLCACDAAQPDGSDDVRCPAWKIDLSSDSCSDEPPHQHNAIISGEGAERRLPQAVFRLESRPGYPNYFAAAFGTKIIAMNPVVVAGRDTHPLVPSYVAPVLDVRTRLFAFAPRPKMNLVDPIFFSVDEKLYALSSGSFQLLHPPPLEEPERQSWCELPKHPFKRRDVTSYILHPDGRTIFVSTKSRTSAATFTFDTAEAHLEWKHHGKWTLPFTGRAHFDSELDAWVGLSGDPGAIGHICACDVASSTSDSGDVQCMAWKLSKEKLLSEDPVEKHVGATLVSMGGRSKFCLVQCVSIDDDCVDKRNFYKVKELQDKELDKTRPCRHLFRLTTFSLKFDKDGHLTTGSSRRVRYYEVPEAATDYGLEDPVGFWIIRKVDLSSDSDSDDGKEPPCQHAAISGACAKLRLPPAVLRLEAPRGLPHTPAFGTRIMAMHPMKPGTDGKLCFMSKLLVPVFDVRTRGVIFAPRHKAADMPDPIYIPVGDRLVALAAGSFEQLWPPPLEHPGGEHWTIVVSTESGTTAATFTLDTDAPCFVWKRLGEWVLPFTGRSHFDCELDAFVGLSKDIDTHGHLCSCDSASSDTGEGHCLALVWKLSKEKLFSEDPAEKHEGATLLYLGGKSRFCLLQCISIEDGCVDEEVQEQDVPRQRRRLFRLTTFSLNYDKNGDLTTGKSRRVRDYKVPKTSSDFLLKNPVAFWL
ncbi:hypothetical protein BAE44_0012169 [Dichanthelium oligosanthes]|uniref:Uncharacterized protein n=1 Tax=Dichanthelium oligosanthes TaxID=888268 RepID=A0A1E5VP19_9POAL|nr:hypothetical protein BAE44_0012169 [Dichanthelium oligosanthes]